MMKFKIDRQKLDLDNPNVPATERIHRVLLELSEGRFTGEVKIEYYYGKVKRIDISSPLDLN